MRILGGPPLLLDLVLFVVRGTSKNSTTRTIPFRQVSARFVANSPGLPERAALARKFYLPPLPICRHSVRMGVRREARERAVQFLYQHDLNAPAELDAVLDHFWRSQQAAAQEAPKSLG